jgi:nucleoside-diphosphate-sugar epimerase
VKAATLLEHVLDPLLAYEQPHPEGATIPPGHRGFLPRIEPLASVGFVDHPVHVPDVVLVTGGAGYVGSVVVEELLGRGFEVRCLDVLRHGNATSLQAHAGDERFTFVEADVRDAAARTAALEDAWAVVHLAAIVGDPACSREPELARDVNLEATRALLADSESAGVRRFLFASTCSNYGRIDSSSFATEELPLNPISLYAETKVEAELEVLDRASSTFATTCLRLATVFGVSPRMRFDLTVNEFTRDALVDGRLVIYGEQFWRPYVHVRDAARAVRLALEAPVERMAGNVFNVGSTNENYRKLDLAEMLTERFPDMVVEFVERREDPRDYRVSFEKVRAGLSFVPESSVPEGIDEVAGLLRSGTVADPYAELYRN